MARAVADYVESFQHLAPVADYVVLNVSSPNTPGLRELQEANALEDLLRTITNENDRLSSPKPILLKIAPDLSDHAIATICDLCEARGVAGIIATNTTLDHSALRAKDETGGLSGRPLRVRSTAIVRFLRSRTLLPIIAAGGIYDAASAQEKLDAGADLLQIYTGYVFRGPQLLREISCAVA
jgi:dihydroorotate dehydrogenase